MRNLYSARSYPTDKLISGLHGVLFSLVREKSESVVVRLRSNHSESFKTVLSNIDETKAYNGPFGFYQGFAYNAKLDRLYYAYPWEYRIKEVDANTGGVLREFGLEFPGYRPISSYADTLDRRAIADSVTNGTMLVGLHALDENRLLSGYIRGDRISNNSFWVVYEINATEIVAYPTIEGSDVPIQMRQEGLGHKAYYSVNDRIYVYSPPTDDEASNGQIDIFSLATE